MILNYLKQVTHCKEVVEKKETYVADIAAKLTKSGFTVRHKTLNDTYYIGAPARASILEGSLCQGLVALHFSPVTLQNPLPARIAHTCHLLTIPVFWP